MLIVLLIVLIVVVLLFVWDFSPKKIDWGVTFSQEYAQNELGLDWQKTYLAILDDLRVDHLRLSAYWNYNQPSPDTYNFSGLDWQVSEASKRGTKIILAVGRKLPRWPECHDPAWIKNLATEEVQQHQLQFIETVIKRYRGIPNITYWQVENEPFLKFFGECPPLDKNFLKKEIRLVKSLDSRPILITDSGELSTWLPAAFSGGKILGTTLYRVVYNPRFGYFHWFLPPSFYYFKALLVKTFSPTSKVIVAELQAESWHKQNTTLDKMSLEEHFASMSPRQFQKNISFARRAGFDEIYLWGVEWWYFLKEYRQYDFYWQAAKKLW
ncbi:MAG: hypothetical protein WC518_03840 [Patescibacteria group bacterium]